MTGGNAADLFLSLCALAGLLTLSGTIRARDATDPLNRRFLFGLHVTAVLFAGRAALTLTGWEVFGLVVRIAAALIPIAVLILVEGLLRRHAPPWAKVAVAAATAAALVAAVWPSGPGIDPEDLVLMACQILGFLIAGWLVIRRDRTSLSAAEDRAVVRLGCSLVLFVPLGAADFLAAWMGLPVRVAGLAALVLCWLAVSLGREDAGPTGTLRALTVMLGTGGAAALALTGGHELLVPAVVILAALLTAAIIGDAMSLRAEERSMSLLRHMAHGPENQIEFLRGLLAHPQVDGAVLVDDSVIRDLDTAVLSRAFARASVLRRGGGGLATDEAEHVGHLFDRYDATHLLCLRPSPPRLVALAMPALATSPRAELELAAIARLARLMGAGDDT